MLWMERHLVRTKKGHMIIKQFSYVIAFFVMIFFISRINNYLVFTHLGRGIFSKDEAQILLGKFRYYSVASLKNWYLDYLNIFCFLLMIFLFLLFPLCSSWNFNGQTVASRLIDLPNDLVLICCCYLLLQILVYVVNFDNYRKIDVVKSGNNYLTVVMIYFFILASMVLLYKNYELESIVQSQGLKFNDLIFSWSNSGAANLPVVALLNIFLLVLYQRDKNPFFFRANISGNYAGSFMQRMNVILYDFFQITLFVYLFLGGFNLIFGLSHLVELLPEYLRSLQVCSLAIKVFIVSWAIEMMRALFISRIASETIIAFERASIGIGAINLLIMMTLWN